MTNTKITVKPLSYYREVPVDKIWLLSVLPIFALGYWLGILNHRRKAHEEALNSVREKSELLAQVQTVQAKYETLKSQGDELSSTMKTEFKLMAQTLLEEKSSRFLDLNQKNMFGLLEPLKERLKDFEKKVDDFFFLFAATFLVLVLIYYLGASLLR